jgi:hypothetical protein
VWARISNPLIIAGTYIFSAYVYYTPEFDGTQSIFHYRYEMWLEMLRAQAVSKVHSFPIEQRAVPLPRVSLPFETRNAHLLPYLSSFFNIEGQGTIAGLPQGAASGTWPFEPNSWQRSV